MIPWCNDNLSLKPELVLKNLTAHNVHRNTKFLKLLLFPSTHIFNLKLKSKYNVIDQFYKDNCQKATTKLAENAFLKSVLRNA